MAQKFEIFKGTNSEYFFKLKAGNGENILGSQSYITKHGCNIGITSVKTHAQHDERYERKVSVNNKYYFVLKSSNGEVIGKSEMYESKAGMESGIESVKNNAPSAPIADLTQE
jgi:uncharacterized protein YegP (UPF0339 family)